MRRLRRLASWFLLLLAVVAEAWFAWTLLRARPYLGWGALAHLLGAIVLFAGMRLRRVPAERRTVVRLHSIKDEHLLPTAATPAASSSPATAAPGAPINLPGTLSPFPDPVQSTAEDPEPPPRDDLWTRLALPVGFFLPLFGTPGLVLLTLVLRLEEREYLQAVEEYRSFIRFRQVKKKQFHHIDVREEARRRLDIEPVVDLLATSEKNLVWGSIEVLSKLSDERAVGMIRRTMDRQDMDVKFYSAWGLDRIEQKFQQQRLWLEAQLSRQFALGPLYDLLQTFDRMQEASLLEGPLHQRLARAALEWVERGLQAWPDQEQLFGYRAYFLSHAGETAQARAAYLELMQLGRLPERFFPDAAALFFRAREFQQVEQLMQVFTANPANEPHLAGKLVETSLDDLRDLWATRQEHAA